MLITRYRDQSIMLNDQILITLHDFTPEKVMVHTTNLYDGHQAMDVFNLGEEGYSISEWGTTLTPVSVARDTVTFKIEHDPAVKITRVQDEVMN